MRNDTTDSAKDKAYTGLMANLLEHHHNDRMVQGLETISITWKKGRASAGWGVPPVGSAEARPLRMVEGQGLSLRLRLSLP